MNDSTNSVRCFKRQVPATVADPWVTRWQQQFNDHSMSLPSTVMESLGQLMPLLMCGEQSAALVFNREADRTHSQRSSQLFREIEAEEVVHDDALQTIYSNLPVSKQEAEIKRRAKRFYVAMGSVNAPAEELFARIQHLDSCVCAIMDGVEKGKIGKQHPFAHVFRRVKQDEARHVGVSRQHLQWMGSDRQRISELGIEIRSQLIELIRPDTDHWEAIGVDWDKLERQILS